jgi:hypothetical protein
MIARQGRDQHHKHLASWRSDRRCSFPARQSDTRHCLHDNRHATGYVVEDTSVEAHTPIMRDIDQIIAAVKQQIPEVTVWQLQKKHPADDDGVWWFALPGVSNDVQMNTPLACAHF